MQERLTAAMETPKLFVGNVRGFFRKLR